MNSFSTVKPIAAASQRAGWSLVDCLGQGGGRFEVRSWHYMAINLENPTGAREHGAT